MYEDVQGKDRLPDEFDEVTSEIKYPRLTEETTDEQFVKEAGNGYLFWAVGASITGLCGLAMFVWGIYELTKVF